MVRRPVAAVRAALRALLLLLSVGLLPLTATPAQAGGALAERWFVIETPHFRVHYHAATEAIAHEVALLCEQAHAVLAPIFGHVPSRPTDVVLIDEVDSANGSARVVPTNLIRLHAYPPEVDSNLGDFDHWMWILIVHEYAHILHLDTMSGLPDLANKPFGKRFAPNSALPRWFIEGIATYHESVHSGGGRMESALFLAYLRMAVLEDRVPRPGQLSGSPVEWPRATGWYLFGSQFIAWLSRNHGWDALVDFTEHYGRRVLPFGMNIVGREHLGDDFISLWDRWVTELQGRFVAESLVLRRHGETRPEPVTRSGERTRVVRTTPDGRPAWLLEDGRGPVRLVVHGREDEAVRLETSGTFAFLPDGSAAIVSLRGTYRRYYGFRDLYRVDLESGEVQRLTWGLRAREPDISPCGTRVVFVTPRDGRADLDELDLATGEVRTRFRAPDWGQAARPRYVGHADRIVFSLLEENRGRDIALLEGPDGNVRRLTSGRGFDIDPVPTPDGRHVIFAGDRDDRFDLYAIRLSDSEVRRITRVESGLFSPAWVELHPGAPEIWASHYSGRGFDVVRLPLEGDLDTLWPTLELAADAREREVYVRPDVDIEVAAPRRHRPVGDTRLHRWLPVLAMDREGAAAGLTAQGADAPERHAWLATVAWDLDATQPIGQLAWTDRSTRPRWNAGLQREFLTRTRGLFVGSDWVPYTEERWSARFGTSFPLASIESGQSFSVGWFGDWRRPRDDARPPPSPEDFAPIFPEGSRQSGVSLSWNWSRVDRTTWGISAERGTGLTLGTRLRTRALGADDEGAELLGTVRQYVPIPGLAHHVLALRLNGGAGVSADGQRNLFAVGGPQAQDLFVALVDDLPASTLATRGFPPSLRRGDRFVRGTAEYRLPLLDLDAGPGTLPLYLGRLHAVGFLDAADAFTGPFRPGELLVGAGAELRLTTILAYYQPAGFRAGVARGLGSEGVLDVYLRYGGAW